MLPSRSKHAWEEGEWQDREDSFWGPRHMMHRPQSVFLLSMCRVPTKLTPSPDIMGCWELGLPFKLCLNSPWPGWALWASEMGVSWCSTQETEGGHLAEASGSHVSSTRPCLLPVSVTLHPATQLPSEGASLTMPKFTLSGPDL